MYAKVFLVAVIGGVITAGAVAPGTTGSSLVLDKTAGVINFVVDGVGEALDAVGRIGDTVGNDAPPAPADGS